MSRVKKRNHWRRAGTGWDYCDRHDRVLASVERTSLGWGVIVRRGDGSDGCELAGPYGDKALAQQSAERRAERAGAH